MEQCFWTARTTLSTIHPWTALTRQATIALLSRNKMLTKKWRKFRYQLFYVKKMSLFSAQVSICRLTSEGISAILTYSDRDRKAWNCLQDRGHKHPSRAVHCKLRLRSRSKAGGTGPDQKNVAFSGLQGVAGSRSRKALPTRRYQPLGSRRPSKYNSLLKKEKRLSKAGQAELRGYSYRISSAVNRLKFPKNLSKDTILDSLCLLQRLAKLLPTSLGPKSGSPRYLNCAAELPNLFLILKTEEQ